MEMLLDGASRYHVCQLVSEKWGLSTRTADRYIRWANTRISRQAEKQDKNIYDKIKHRLNRQYLRAIKDKDGMLARLILSDMRKFYGVDTPIEIKHSGKLTLEKTEEYRFVFTEIKKLKPADRREILKLLEQDDSNGEAA
jgi:hypothetical protein